MLGNGVRHIARGLEDGHEAIQEDLSAASAALADRAAAPGVHDAAVRARTAALTEADFSRGEYADRLVAQDAALDLPFLPTTTIGSFPQTADIRRARAQLAKGVITDAEFEAQKAKILAG